jgi:selenocysteine-specific elongation factor
MTVVIGTAGHIDHGKTTLLRALTGIDADRLPEEQRRGMTIDVGYTHLTLPDGRQLDFVDVPGHDRLVGNMLVGAGEVDAVMLVVAGDEGPRAQTIEHLDLVDALGLRHGLVVITKTDLVDDARAEHVAFDVKALLERTGLSDAPVLRVSATGEHGIEQLIAALVELADRVDAAVASRDQRASRLAIDRVFSVKGRGVVVTGSLRGGAIARGDSLRLVPGDQRVLVREVQVHGEAVDHAGSGRTALNLRGIEATTLRRGQVLTDDPEVVASSRMLVALHAPPRLNAAWHELPADRARLRLHIGTDQVDASVGRAGREAAALPDGRVTALLRLDRPIAVAPRDRFVLRRPSTRLTEAGGVVLDPLPPVGVARRRVTAVRLVELAAATAVAQRQAAHLDLHGVVLGPDGPALAPDVQERLAAVALRAVEAHHRERPDDTGIALSSLRAAVADDARRVATLSLVTRQSVASLVVDRLVDAGRLVRDGDQVRDPAHAPGDLPSRVVAARDRLVGLLDTASPPSLAVALTEAGCTLDDVRALERDGRVVRLDDDLAWSADAYAALGRRALEMATRSPLTPAELRDATGTSRKYVMAILEDLDRRGVLRRTPTGHLPGPRAASLAR